MRTVAKSPLDILRAMPDITSRGGYYVYFLWDGDELVYVGSTCTLLVRLAQHRPRKRFTRATAYEYASDDDMMTAEALYTLRYKPKYNKLLAHKYADRAMPKPIGIVNGSMVTSIRVNPCIATPIPLDSLSCRATQTETIS